MTGRIYSTDLSKLLSGIYAVPAVLDTRVHGIQLDSRRVRKGDLFIALSGARYPSGAHVDEAVARGANAVLVEGQLHTGKVHEAGDAVELYLPNLRELVGVLADRFFQQPSHDLRVVGVTGTNGKTSVSNYIAQLLEGNNITAGVIGTLGVGVVEQGKKLNPLEHTTPNVVDVHRYLALLRDEGAEAVVMEVSSHGLEQGRVDCVQFEGAVFTNLTRDHLDYHGTMEAYGAAKAKLFTRPELKFAIVNYEDDYSREIVSKLAADVRCIEYGEHATAELHASNVRYQKGLNATLSFSGKQSKLNSELVGRFNLYNLMASLATGVAMGLTFESIKGLDDIRSVPGRMNIFAKSGKPTVVIDYAHTPDALENILKTIKEHHPKRLLLVFGCGGDRDVGKRPLMAKVAENLADHIVVTDDNPRNEDPDAIIADILKGFQSTEEVEVSHDRAEAIQAAIASAQEGDWVLVAGKGHEAYQEVAGKRLEFSDLELAKRCLGIESPEGGTEVPRGA